MDFRIIKAKKASIPLGHYSQAYVYNNIIYIATQIGLNKNKQIGSIKEQVNIIFQSLQFILEEARSDLSAILKITIYISDINNWDEVNELYCQYMKENKPPRGVIPCLKLHHNADIAFDVTAYVKD